MVWLNYNLGGWGIFVRPTQRFININMNNDGAILVIQGFVKNTLSTAVDMFFVLKFQRWKAMFP